MPDSVGVSTAIGTVGNLKRTARAQFRFTRLCERVTRGDHVAFRFSPAAGKKNGEKTWNRTRHSNPRLPPSARTRQRVCTRQTGGEEGESHQPDARRINAIIARSAWRFIDTWPHHFGCPLIGRLIVSLLIPPVWLFVPIYALVTLFFFLLVRFPCTLLCNFVSR